MGQGANRNTERVIDSPRPHRSSDGARRRRSPWRTAFSVRTRIVAVITLVAALGLTVVGATVYLVERAVSLEAIENRLQDNLDSARFIVANGEDPTGTWTSADAALKAVVQRMSPDDNTGAIGIIDGRAVMRSGIDLDLDLTRASGFVPHVSEQVDGPDALIGTYAEDGVIWRYLAAPIAVAGGSAAEEVIFAMAYDVRAELAEIDGTARAYLVAAALALLVIAAVATIVSTRLLRPLRQMRETAERVSAQALSERLPVQGRDDVSELAATMKEVAADAEVVIMAAAVADYRPVTVSDRKLTKESGGVPAIELTENEDIVAALVSDRRQGQIIVGFAAETPEDEQELLERARRKQQRKGVDLLVVNEVGWERGFERADNAVHILGAEGADAGTASGSKREVAGAVWDAVNAVRSHWRA